MDLEKFFPVWNMLTPKQKEALTASAAHRFLPAGSALHQGKEHCSGLVLIESGRLRVYIMSEDGREITLYRLLENDICLFSASCWMQSIQFDVQIEAEEDSELIIIPSDIYQELSRQSAAIAGFTNKLMADRFSEVIWLMEQIMWKSFDKRLASFLLEESNLINSTQLRLTHETIAKHMGTAREVVTRMLKYFQKEGWVSLSRGTIELTDLKKLRELN